MAQLILTQDLELCRKIRLRTGEALANDGPKGPSNYEFAGDIRDIDEERLADRFHCIKYWDQPHNQQQFRRLGQSSLYRQAVENVMYGIRAGTITPGPFNEA